MTQDEIILIADASGLSFYGMGKDRDKFVHYLAAFAALVAAAEREVCIDAMMQTTRIAVDAAMALQREACAKLCEGRLQEGLNFEGCAAAIRARGQA